MTQLVLETHLHRNDNCYRHQTRGAFLQHETQLNFYQLNVLIYIVALFRQLIENIVLLKHRYHVFIVIAMKNNDLGSIFLTIGIIEILNYSLCKSLNY